MARGLREIFAPLGLLIWIHGFYVALGVLLRGTEPQTPAAPALVALTWVYRLSVLGTLCWLLSHIGRLIDALLITLPARTESFLG
jgi:hypothetical protein